MGQRHAARGKQRMDVAREVGARGLAQIEIVEREDRGTQAEPLDEPARKGGLAAALRPADAEDQRARIGIEPARDRPRDDLKRRGT